MKTTHPTTPQTLSVFLLTMEDATTIECHLIYQGVRALRYVFLINGKVLFEGDDFCPGVLASIDSLDAQMELFEYLCEPFVGDLDDPYSHYNEAQQEWFDSWECDQLDEMAFSWRMWHHDRDSISELKLNNMERSVQEAKSCFYPYPYGPEASLPL